MSEVETRHHRGVTQYLVHRINGESAWIDIYRAIGAEAQGSRYQSREKLGILLGPTANKLEGVVRAVANSINGDWGPADTRRIRRLVVGQNLPGIRRLFDQIGEE